MALEGLPALSGRSGVRGKNPTCHSFATEVGATVSSTLPSGLHRLSGIDRLKLRGRLMPYGRWLEVRLCGVDRPVLDGVGHIEDGFPLVAIRVTRQWLSRLVRIAN